MRKLSLAVLMLIAFTACAHAATPKQIAAAYKADSAAALQEYGWESMEFSGPVTACAMAYNDCATIWAVNINAGEIDVIGYTARRIGVGTTVKLKGICSGFRLAGERVTVVLDGAKIE
jgi:hypothetical protein